MIISVFFRNLRKFLPAYRGFGGGKGRFLAVFPPKRGVFEAKFCGRKRYLADVGHVEWKIESECEFRRAILPGAAQNLAGTYRPRNREI